MDGELSYCGLLFGLRLPSVECGGIVKALDEVEDIGARLLPLAVPSATTPLELQRREDALPHRVVQRVAGATHATAHA